MGNKIVQDFCSLLSPEEKYDIFSLLLEYSTSMNRLGFLFNRAEEYKLVLHLSQKKSHSALSAIRSRFHISIFLGAVSGIVTSLLLFAVLNGPAVFYDAYF